VAKFNPTINNKKTDHRVAYISAADSLGSLEIYLFSVFTMNSVLKSTISRRKPKS